MPDRRPRSEADLAELVEDLTATLDDLRRDVDPEVARRPGPRPPGPRDLIRFTESYTIPTLIALLEAAVRSLELLGATLRLADGRGVDTDREGPTVDLGFGLGGSGGARTAVRDRALSRVDDALGELQTALEGGEPTDETSRELLADARELREEIDSRLGESRDRERDRRRQRRPGSGSSAGHEIPVRGSDPTGRADSGSDLRSGDEDAEDASGVDVDAELQSIREEVSAELDEEFAEDVTVEEEPDRADRETDTDEGGDADDERKRRDEDEGAGEGV